MKFLRNKKVKELIDHINKLQAIVEVQELRLNNIRESQERVCYFCLLTLPLYAYPAEKHIAQCHKLHCDCGEGLKCESFIEAKRSVFKDPDPPRLRWR